MRKRLTISSVIAGATALVYPYFERLADIERGYDSSVFGDEEMIAILGIIVIPIILIVWDIGGVKKDKPIDGGDTAELEEM